MKKAWSNPDLLDLTISSTERGNGGGNGFGGGHGGGIGGGNNSNLCHCFNGTSPCKNHGHKEGDLWPTEDPSGDIVDVIS